jgi:hypothetical protein
MIRNLLIFVSLIIGCSNGYSQYASRKFSQKQQVYIDSLKQVEYKYIFPIWGQEAYKQGFDIPYPAGIMANFFYAKMGLILEDMQLGIKTEDVDIPLTDVGFIEFGDNTSTVWSINVRPDLWVFPFLNVYGIFGYGKSNTLVNLEYPISFQSSVDQNIRTAGFGVTGAFGLGPVWMVLDGNWTWNKPELLEKPVYTKVFSIRVGHSVVFPNKPQSNIAFWVGAMRLRMGAETVGEIKMADALPQEVWDTKDEIVQNYWDWYNDLNPLNPDDLIKIKAADEVLTPIVEKIDALDGQATIRYGMNKRPAEEWNMLIGAQYQFNKRWIIRTEGGFLGDRKSFLLSLNYRFKV